MGDITPRIPAPRRRGRVPALTAGFVALLLALGLLPAAAADCDDWLADCDWSGDSYPPIPMEVHQFTALVPLRADNDGFSTELYERIVRGLGFEVPAEPVVALWAVEVDIPNRVLENPWFPGSVRWMEGAISLRVRQGDEEGWSHISMPTDSDFAYDLGREAGMPKYMGTMSIEQTATGWATQTSVGDRVASHYDFTPADPDVVPEPLLRDWAMHRDPYLHALPVFEGPRKTRVKYTALPLVPAGQLLPGEAPPEAAVAPVTAIAEPQTGTIAYEIDPALDALHTAAADESSQSEPMPTLFGPSESLADLIETSGAVPGEFLQSTHHLLIQTTEIDE